MICKAQTPGEHTQAQVAFKIKVSQDTDVSPAQHNEKDALKGGVQQEEHAQAHAQSNTHTLKHYLM